MHIFVKQYPSYLRPCVDVNTRLHPPVLLVCCCRCLYEKIALVHVAHYLHPFPILSGDISCQHANA